MKLLFGISVMHRMLVDLESQKEFELPVSLRNPVAAMATGLDLDDQ